MSALRKHATGQDGYTLVEVVVATAIAAILMAGLTSVVLTSVRAANVATSRVEASTQIRSFQYFAYDDFARSSPPSAVGCGTVDTPCSTQPIVLNGLQVSNEAIPVPTPYQVQYAWVRCGTDSAGCVDRQARGASSHVATNVTGFAWYIDDTTGSHVTVVIMITVTVGSYNESQTLRFLPQVTG